MLNFDALNFAELWALSGDGSRAPADERKRIAAWAKDRPTVFNAKPGKDELELSILGVIGESFFGDGISARAVKQALDAADSPKSIRVLVDSPGGDYFDGVAILNLLKRCAARVTVEVIGEATSAASVIALAGDRIEMHSGTTMMIHRAWGGAQGNADEMRNTADLLDKLDTSLMTLYSQRTGKALEECARLVQATTWMTAAEAVAEGFADAELPAKLRPTSSEKTLATHSVKPIAVRALGALRQSSH